MSQLFPSRENGDQLRMNPSPNRNELEAGKFVFKTGCRTLASENNQQRKTSFR